MHIQLTSVATGPNFSLSYIHTLYVERSGSFGRVVDWRSKGC